MPYYENIKFKLFIHFLKDVKFCTTLWKPLTSRPTPCTKKKVVYVIRIVIINKFESRSIHRIHIMSVLIHELSGIAQTHVQLLMLSASSLKTRSEITISYHFPLTFSHSFVLSLYRCDRQTLLHELTFFYPLQSTC
jgi:hypothetical protein